MNFLDKAIAYINPAAGVKRAAQRAAIENIRSFEAASKSRRTENWRATGADANAELTASLSVLRNRSREQVRNNVYARRTVQAITTNTIGTGIRPTPMEVSRTGEKRIMTLWKSWAGKKRCDFDGNLSFYGIQKLVMRTLVTSGECLVLKRRSNDKTLPLKLQVLEPDFIDTHKSFINKDDGSFVIHGIQFNKDGQKQGYWLYQEHPGSMRVRSLTSRFVKADDVAHIFAVERPGQVRGVPWLSASMIRMKDFDEYEDAELLRQKIAACFTVFVQDSNPDAVTGNTDEADLASRVEPGIIEILPPGKTVSFAQPPLTNGYESYSRKILQGIAAGTGITYESMTGDLSNVNFSSGRMGWIEFQRNIQDWQEDIIIPMLCETVWEWFLDAATIVGKIKGDIEASWTPPRREMIDPKKEAEALALQVRNGFMSYQEALRQLGYDPEDTLDEIAAFNSMVDEKGITLDCDPRVGKMAPSVEDEKDKDGQSDDENDDESSDDNKNENKGSDASSQKASTKGTTAGKTTVSKVDTTKARSLKEIVDAYGAGVRAGAITPTLDDEKYLRQLAELPDPTKAVEDAWSKDGGVRRPITLKVDKGSEGTASE